MKNRTETQVPCWCCGKLVYPEYSPYDKGGSVRVVGHPELRVCYACDKATKRTSPITIGNAIAKYVRQCDKREAQQRKEAERLAAEQERYRDWQPVTRPRVVNV